MNAKVLEHNLGWQEVQGQRDIAMKEKQSNFSISAHEPQPPGQHFVSDEEHLPRGGKGLILHYTLLPHGKHMGMGGIAHAKQKKKEKRAGSSCTHQFIPVPVGTR